MLDLSKNLYEYREVCTSVFILSIVETDISTYFWAFFEIICWVYAFFLVRPVGGAGKQINEPPFVNILFWPGLIIDLATGTMFRYDPTEYQFDFTQ